MSSPSKSKGRRWQNALVKYLQPAYPRVKNNLDGAHPDVGDLGELPFCVQAKDQKTWHMSEWLNDTVEQTTNGHYEFGVLVVKRPRHKPEDAYAVMRFADWLRLAQKAGM